ncbi:MAG TPA: hypothetical protein VKG03_01400, partial [Solirubrobacterales bacterium]|nr:hypothetical protein [Solirubrobacterales bacterium]
MRHPAARLVGLIGLVVLLFVIALGVAIWRYEASRDSSRRALAESQTQLLGQKAGLAITEEEGRAGSYGVDKDPADLRVLRSDRRKLGQAVARLMASPALQPSERAEVQAIVAGQRRLDRIFRKRVVPVAGTPAFRTGVKPFAAEAERIDKRLDAFIGAAGVQARAA